jgi:hypothetical protein
MPADEFGERGVVVAAGQQFGVRPRGPGGTPDQRE